MLIFLAALLLLCLWGVDFKPFQSDYLSIRKTTAIKGIFTVLIFLSHAKGYGDPTLTGDPGVRILSFLGQLVVVMFFFYSGFGIMKQFEKRGDGYVKSFPKNRILKLLVHFDLAVLFFLIVQTLIGARFPLSHYFYCWIGWQTVGNSNWFVFDMLVLYLIMYAALSAIVRLSVSKPFALAILCLLSLSVWLFLHFMKSGETWWYNSLIAFPLGAIYSQIHAQTDAFHEKRHWAFALSVLLCAMLWIVLRRRFGVDPYGVSAALFSLAVIGGSSFFSFDNPILQWLGKNCFQIYILQRIPMIVLSHFRLNVNPYIFISGSLFLTVLLAFGFRWLTGKLDKVLFA